MRGSSVPGVELSSGLSFHTLTPSPAPHFEYLLVSILRFAAGWDPTKLDRESNEKSISGSTQPYSLFIHSLLTLLSGTLTLT